PGQRGWDARGIPTLELERRRDRHVPDEVRIARERRGHDQVERCRRPAMRGLDRRQRDVRQGALELQPPLAVEVEGRDERRRPGRDPLVLAAAHRRHEVDPDLGPDLLERPGMAGPDRDVAPERLAGADRHRVERDRRRQVVDGRVGCRVQGELADVDDAGPEEGHRLDDPDGRHDRAVEARSIELGLHGPVDPEHGPVHARGPEARNRDLEGPRAGLALGQVERSRELDRDSGKLGPRGHGPRRRMPLPVGGCLLVLPRLDPDEGHEEPPGVGVVVRGHGHPAGDEPARQQPIALELELPVDAVARVAPDRHWLPLVPALARPAAIRPGGRPRRPMMTHRPEGSYHRGVRSTTEMPMPTFDTIRQAPKALLHDHLDGGLRPSTVIDLAREFHYDALPTTDVDELSAWFRRGADRKSLELYLETFAHTFGVMQERDAIIRVAAECAEDLAADGVSYAEVRYAPELSTERGMTLDEVVDANLEGFRIGMERAATAGHPIVMKMLVTAMRQAARSVEVAECALRWRDAGVVGFDVAGPEKGYPPTRYLDAFDRIRRDNFHITIHAGES